MSNYRFIMRTEDSIVSNEGGRLVMEDKDEWAKLSTPVVMKNTRKDLLITIRVLRVNRVGWKKLLIITDDAMRVSEKSLALLFAPPAPSAERSANQRS